MSYCNEPGCVLQRSVHAHDPKPTIADLQRQLAETRAEAVVIRGELQDCWELLDSLTSATGAEDYAEAVQLAVEARAEVERLRVMLTNACPEESMSQDEQGGCVWCAGPSGLRKGATYAWATNDPKDHYPDCAWLVARNYLGGLPAAATPPNEAEEKR